MKFARFSLPSALILALASCIPLDPEVISQDCAVPVVPANFTRIFIGSPARGGQQAGTSADDPLDGTSADKFDTILRTIAEGQQPTWGTQKNIPQENLIVCLASGTFQTNGQSDWIIDVGHTKGAPRGFTVERNWKIHGRGVNHTKLQLASYVEDQYVDDQGASFTGGSNVVIGAHSDNASGVELSNMTIDANHDQLTFPGGAPLNLEGVVLRSIAGKHWIHDINVIGASGDLGFKNIIYESFALQIWGSAPVANSNQSTGNLIEKVNVTKPGRPMTNSSPPGGSMDGIVVNNAATEIRNNVVEGYYIAYGGWNMNEVWFHDNISRNTAYGFNADAFTNVGVTLQSNQFIHPTKYGIIIGGAGAAQTFSDWHVLNNTVTLHASGTIALGIRGQVQNSSFTDNTIQPDGGTAHNLTAILSFPSANGVANFSNNFQDNHIDGSMHVDFSQDPNFNTNCRFQNRDLQGRPIPSFPDNSGRQCK